MKRKRTLLASLALLAVAAISILAYRHYQRDPIRCENFQYLKPGMTKAEVEALVGCAPGDYRTKEIVRGPGGGIIIHFSESTSHWQSNDHDFTAYWDNDERYLGCSNWNCAHIGLVARLRMLAGSWIDN